MKGRGRVKEGLLTRTPRIEIIGLSRYNSGVQENKKPPGTVALSEADLEAIPAPLAPGAAGHMKTIEISRADLEAVQVPRPTRRRSGAEAGGSAGPADAGAPRADAASSAPESGGGGPGGGARPVVDNPFTRTIIDNRYEVVRGLGAGAMGSVFLVRHLHLGKLFALKMINPDVAGEPEFESRFQREAAVSSRLDHPNCIRVTDFGRTSDGSLFLIMEYADGASLGDRIAATPLPLAEALDTVRQVLLGLQHAHSLGLVHRDIKPENIVQCRREDGASVIKILDFGMAKVPVTGPDNVDITREGVVLGTPQYMAPEQVRGDTIDERVDLYALGVTLLRMISGKDVFEGEAFLDVFAAKFNAPAPSLKALTGCAHPPELEEFVAKAVARQSADRFSSAAEMLAALDRVEAALHARLSGADKERAEPRAPSAPFGAKLARAVLPAAAGVRAAVGSGRRIAAGVLVEVRDDAVRWWRCEGCGGRSWSRRLRGLWSTPVGRAVLLRVAAVAAVTAVVVSSSIRSGDARSAVPEPTLRSDHEAPVSAVTVAAVAKAAGEAAPSPDPALVEVGLLIDQKKCRRAAEILDEVTPLDDPLVRYLKGRAGMCLGDAVTALAHYRKAVAFEPSYRTDTRILEDAREMAVHPRLRLQALDLMAHQLGETALPTLVHFAERHPHPEARGHARDLAAEKGVLGHVDLVHSLEMDLNQARTCREKREIVGELAALGTKKARQTLYRVRDVQVKDGFFRKRYKNECIRKDINRALAEMGKRRTTP